MTGILSFLKKFWIPVSLVLFYFLLAGLNILPAGINIFKKKQLVIDNTPIIVKEIRDIGELSTSEFYGEVYADINEVYEDLITEFSDSIKINPAGFYRNYSGLREYMGKADEFNKIVSENQFAKARYDSILKDYSRKLGEYGIKQNNLVQQISALSDDKKEKRALNNQLDNLKQEIENAKALFSQEQRNYMANDQLFGKRREEFQQYKKERNLVYIGRGWVKAGIDLKKLNEKNIVIEKGDSLSIEILVEDPDILDADINPWFIYTDEKKVKGFEVFVAKTGSIFADKNFTDYEVTMLKHKCKEKLKEAAIEKGLMKNARTSTMQTLENFFKMLGFGKVKVSFKSTSIQETT